MSAICFRAMGTQIELRIDGAPSARASSLLSSGRRFIDGFDSALTRFAAGSELSRVNADGAETVGVSWLMGEFIEAALWAATASGGLVDPTITPALIRAGYAESRAGATPADLMSALEEAPARRAARPDPTSAWRAIVYDRRTRTLTRPAGVTLDSGGVGKGLAADLLARSWSTALGPGADFCIDCGGDIRFGPRGNRWGQIGVENPFSDTPLPLAMTGGAVATTSIRNRIWRGEGGAPAHHLIDPRAGLPAWTGVVAVTALAPTALVAETIAKIAFLRGERGATETLAAADGGVVIFDDCSAQYVAPELAAAA
ncbi:MAG: FAD:protein FMN transferase [Solirubrobacterales bacterium]